jgi:endoglycosylceramidase
MHQDLYSVLYSDGAPAWATITGGAPHVDLGGVWSDAYFTSPAVQTALDNFWDNASAPDGVGLQQHYARAWALLARRYAGERAVLGYDIMNEPFPGSAAVQAQALMFAKGAELIADLGVPLPGAAAKEADATPASALATQWLTPEGRAAILELLGDIEIFTQVVDATAELYGDFERTRLMAMYRRVARAIRATGETRALFLETTMGSNMGVYSAIEPVILGGERDPAQVYAPHGYDLVVDTPGIADASSERVELIFRRHGETAQRLSMPLLVGEWGAYGRNPDTLPAAWHVVRQFEKLLCGETYWAYERGIEDVPCFPAIQRPYPERVAGTLEGYHYDPETATLEVTWREDGQVAAPSRIYLPGRFAGGDVRLDLTPKGLGATVAATSERSGSCYVGIPPLGEACHRHLVVR